MHRILEMITGLGYWGILIGLALEVIPSEIVLAYAGYLVFKGEINVTEAVIFGTIGCLLQQVVLYAIGSYGGRPFVDKYGKYLHLKPKHIDMTERWFQRYGPVVVFASRFIPVIRQAISIPAGIARMNMFKFLVYTGLASIPWAIIFILIGKSLGENWASIEEKAGPYTKPILYATVIIIALYILYKYLTRKKRPKPDGDAAVGQQPGAELSTDRQLEQLGGEYKVLRGRRIRTPSGSQPFGHLVVGPNGIFHIETKPWEGSIRFTPNGVERSGEEHKEDPTALLYRHEYVLKELLREHKLQADIVGVLCFSNPDCTIAGSSPAFAAVKLDRLVHTIESHKPKRRLEDRDVLRIAELLERSGTAG